MSFRYMINLPVPTAGADSRHRPPRPIESMMTLKFLLRQLVVLGLTGWLALSGVAEAEPVDGQPVLLAARESQEKTRSGLSQREAEEIVARATGGQVLNARPSGQGYDVRVLLDQGRVRTFHVKADGAVSSRR